MSDLANIISQLEQQEASIHRAIEALRDITNTTTAPDKPVRSAPMSSSDGRSEGRQFTSDGRRRLAEAMKRRWAAKRAAAKKANKNASRTVATSTGKTADATKRRALSAEQKRAISKAWTPERKQKFAEFHVQRMARERGEDPAKALREYRRRKQKEQAGASGPRKTSAKAVPRKTAVKKSTARVGTAAAS